MPATDIDSAPETTSNSGRDAGGRFAKGNAGGPGNPFARRSAQVRAQIMTSVSDDDIRDITRKLIDMAKAGDIAAAKLIFERTAGRVADPVDPDWVELNGKKIDDIYRSRRDAEERQRAFERRMKERFGTEEGGDFDGD